MIDFPVNPTIGQQFTTAGVTWTWDGFKWTLTPPPTAVAYLPLAGGVMTGALTLAADPTLPLQAATKEYVDTAVAAGGGGGGGGGLPLTGGTLTGPLAGTSATFSGQVSGASGVFTGMVNAASYAGPTGASPPVAAASPPPGDNSLDLATTAWVTAMVNAAVSGVAAIGDNRLINGDMRIDQRNSGASGTAAQVYTVDRWRFGASVSGNVRWGQSGSVLAGFPTALGVTSLAPYVPAASDYFDLYQVIEADMISDFAWGTASAQPVTLSFWAVASQAGTYSGAIANVAGTRSYPFSFSLPTANIWTKCTITIPGDTGGTWVMSGNMGSTIVCFDLGAGTSLRGPANAWASANYIGVTGAASLVATTNATFSVTGAKLEIGNVATPYNRQTLAKSMSDCQRYFQTGNGYILSPIAGAGLAFSGALYDFLFATYMRGTPTMNAFVLTPAAGWTGGVAVQNMGQSFVSISPATPQSAGAFAFIGFSADAEI
jgi:hypothetical protein